MQGIRALVPSRPFPITDSGLSSKVKSEQLLPREHRKMIIMLEAMEEVTATLALFFLVVQGIEHKALPLSYTPSS